MLAANCDLSSLSSAVSLWPTRSCMVSELGSSEEFYGQSFAASAIDGVLQTLYESVPNTIHIFIRSPRPTSRISFFPTATVYRLFLLLPNALVIRLPYTILTR